MSILHSNWENAVADFDKLFIHNEMSTETIKKWNDTKRYTKNYK